MRAWAIPVLLLCLAAFGCSSRVIIDYDMTHQARIEESIRDLGIVEFLDGHMSRDETLCLRSIEQDMLFTKVKWQGYPLAKEYEGQRVSTAGLDWGTRYMIEDNLVTKLSEAGHRLLERDPELLAGLIAESGEELSLLKYDLNGVTARDVWLGSDLSLHLDGSAADGGLVGSGLKHGTVPTTLRAADKVLSYRVLQCGVLYENIPGEFDKVKRVAVTRLHCRLEDTRTSEILAAGVVQNEVTDELDRDLLDDIESYQTKFYGHELPNINPDSEDEPPTLSAEKKGSGPAQMAAGVLISFVVVTLYLLSRGSD